MRKAPRWFHRRAQPVFPSNSSHIIFVPRIAQNAVTRFTSRRLCLRSIPSYIPTLQRRLLHTEDAILGAPSAPHDLPSAHASVETERFSRPPRLLPWIRSLNRYLPAQLRVSATQELLPQDTISRSPLTARDLEKTITRARSVERLLWLVENGHRDTAVWLMKAILNFSTTDVKKPGLKSPSNLNWPNDLFRSVRSFPISVSAASQPSLDFLGDKSQIEEVDQLQIQSAGRLLGCVWETLGILVVKSAAAGKSTDKTMDDNMLTSLLVLSHIHNLGMVPDDVYAYTHQHRPSFVQRPPILNLVSSRILTALSDVAWRQQQDDAILQAAHAGLSLSEISRSVPGGRFRLKVRPLGHEIWLELILWCCIESHQTSAALAIVKSLAGQTEEPWFAVRWTSSQPGEKPSTRIDWDRIKLRHGGPGGLIEGYSRERPFVDVPEKTISVEVILALVEQLIASTLSSSFDNTDKHTALNTQKDLRSLSQTMADIEDIVTFLEPHDLPSTYFDYLESRLLQDGAFDLTRSPIDLYKWSTKMRSFRGLEKVEAQGTALQTLELKNIHSHSQLSVGLQHQTMDALVQFGDIHHTLTVFNEIQESVDQTKVASIKDFLQQEPMPTEIPALPTTNHGLEFTNSHGQLPYYKLAGLLNLISDTKLIGLGRWLLYADDVDGATLPERAWGLPCMAAAMYKFAAVSEDEALLASTVPKTRKMGWQPSIKMLRARIDANFSLLHLDAARNDLISLRRSFGGGHGLSNIVYLAATILRLENSTSELQAGGAHVISDASSMLQDMLLDSYSSLRSDYTLAQRLLFKQQIRQVLSVFAYLKGSFLQEVAKLYSNQFPPSNLALLPAKSFNVLLSAAVDAHGSRFGQKMWNRFCKMPDTPWAIEQSELDIESLGNASEPGLLLDPNAAMTSDIPFESSNDNMSSENDHTGATDQVLQFEDPFFSQISQTLLEPEHDSQARSEPSPVQSISIQDSPVTIPNVRTLRLITQAAAGEFNHREKAGQPTKIQKSSIAWAVEMFRGFGVVDKSVVEQEIQYPLDEINAEIAEESSGIIEASQHRNAYEMGGIQDLAVGSPVSAMWVPLGSHGR